MNIAERLEGTAQEIQPMPKPAPDFELTVHGHPTMEGGEAVQEFVVTRRGVDMGTFKAHGKTREEFAASQAEGYATAQSTILVAEAVEAEAVAITAGVD
jgi:hypothetical protein